MYIPAILLSIHLLAEFPVALFLIHLLLFCLKNAREHEPSPLLPATYEGEQVGFSDFILAQPYVLWQ